VFLGDAAAGTPGRLPQTSKTRIILFAKLRKLLEISRWIRDEAGQWAK
jgi:hypothetical protein